MKQISLTLCTLALLSHSVSISAYEIDTHEKLSIEAYSASDLQKNPDVQGSLGLVASDKFPGSDGIRKSIIQLIGTGAKFEDDTNGIKRPLNHFYNPLNNQPLTVKGITLGATSPDWALEDMGNINNQSNSFKDARQYFYDALTLPVTQQIRDKFWGLTFQTLGQVIHHIQDMAQPQHVRNDAHCDVGILGCGIFFFNPSLYEKYSDDQRKKGVLPFSGYTPVYSSADTATFSSPRKFWHTTDGKGMADYTNRGFVSAGTIFDSSFPSPVLDINAKLDFDIKALLPGTSLKGNVRFYGNTVTDNYTGASVNNPMEVTSSIFDDDLQKYATLGKKTVFTLNRFNFNAAHALLIPRAVGYSAGLINYFFRGKMQISLPPEGVYSVTDASTSGGFSTVKLVLSNQSPAGEDMTGGQVVAVAKFHTNTCYKNDLSGEIGLPANSYSTCRSSAEQIIVSAPNPLTLAVGASSTPLSFVFSSPIPLSATDLYLHVVYRGQLGQELDAVAVTTLDIAEPTTFDITNMTDYFLLNGIFYKIPTPYNQTTVPSQVDPALFAYIDVNANGIYNPGIDNNLSRRSLSYQFAFGGGTALGSMTVTPSGFARFAVLVNNANGPNTVLKLTKQTYGYTEAIPIAPNINQQDAVSGLPTYSPPDLSRGHYVYQSSPDHGFYPTIVPIPPTLDALLNLVPQAISINFP